MGTIIKFLANAFSGVLSFIFNTLVVKFFVFGCVFIAVTEIVPILIETFLPKQVHLSTLISKIPPGIAYFLNFFKVEVGIQSMLSAYTSRFLIRRIPLVG
ncbi:DUF2523 family protein [[Haemophilus] ducreyi]|uniref:DUF2523 family protein n=1 Tax=Haemophilus ducreyi TaxID=730 RepID=UPI000655C6AD|nr:DUF2523 family protein [[Haemophilus] ducreyi]AKO45630.1 hypothetical protein RZ66_05210 [[Haemophilus] ducreyi]AKO47016.1 hypothetical protein RZ67_05125 [[Haemophilus] ducreyi]AKO48361.1 hypothetical protein RZ68_05110 [[Haemophilus] ducreyi]AKO49748.1 hypothetical protein RZ69_05150 [[Haemophilus] ducreyi]ANF61356.1 hypothetical protein A6037_00490 [[Haemophilus] ducreyi]